MFYFLGKVAIKKEDLCNHSGKETWFSLQPVDSNSEVQVNIKALGGVKDCQRTESKWKTNYTSFYRQRLSYITLNSGTKYYSPLVNMWVERNALPHDFKNNACWVCV